MGECLEYINNDLGMGAAFEEERRIEEPRGICDARALYVGLFNFR